MNNIKSDFLYAQWYINVVFGRVISVASRYRWRYDKYHTWMIMWDWEIYDWIHDGEWGMKVK